MIRPEAAAVLQRWRDALIGAALIALGLYWFTKTFGLLSWVGAALTLIGALIGFAGLQRARVPLQVDFRHRAGREVANLSRRAVAGPGSKGTKE